MKTDAPDAPAEKGLLEDSLKKLLATAPIVEPDRRRNRSVVWQRIRTIWLVRVTYSPSGEVLSMKKLKKLRSFVVPPGSVDVSNRPRTASLSGGLPRLFRFLLRCFRLLLRSQGKAE